MTPQRQIAFITGANQGIGRAVANQLARDHDYHVVIGSRSLAAGEEAATAIRKDGFEASAVQLDLTSDDSILAAVKELEKLGKLDVLINNAGILIDHSKDILPRELYKKTFETNIFGPALLTEALLPLLQKNQHPRVVFVSSIMGSVTRSLDKTTLWYPIDYRYYDSSKAALNMIAVNFARILDNGFVNVVCPGLNNTQLTGFSMGHSPDIGAKRVVEVATASKATGTFSDINGDIPW